MKWLLIVLTTSGRLALDMDTQERCLEDMQKVNAGVYVTVELSDGRVFPVLRALRCESEAEFDVRKGFGA